MNHVEVFDEILKRHGYTMNIYSEKSGHANNYYFELFNKRDTVPGDTFCRIMTELGARVYGDNGKVRVDLAGAMSEMSRIPLWSTICIMKALGYSLVVADGDREFIVDTGVVDEANKIRGRKKGKAARIHADLHGAGAV